MVRFLWSLFLTWLYVTLLYNGTVLAKTLRIAIEGAYPPFSETRPSGEVVGFDIDIAKALCTEMAVPCRLIKQEWDGLVPGLLAGKFDAILASMTITHERKKKVAFSDKYYYSPAKFVRKKGSGITLNRKDLRGKVVGVQRGTTADRYVEEVYGGDLRIKRYATQDEAYIDMQAGRIDLLLADRIPLDLGFLKKAAGRNFEFFGPDLTDEQYFGEGAGIAVRKDDKMLLKALNQALIALHQKGVYKKIQDKYFDFNIYGR